MAVTDFLAVNNGIGAVHDELTRLGFGSALARDSASARIHIAATCHRCDERIGEDADDYSEVFECAVRLVRQARAHLSAHEARDGRITRGQILEVLSRSLRHTAGRDAEAYIRALERMLVPEMQPCCERDIDGDGNCDRHPSK